jgi:hypothetical protein
MEGSGVFNTDLIYYQNSDTWTTENLERLIHQHMTYKLVSSKWYINCFVAS